MRRHGGLIALGWAVAAWLACSETETRPPISGDCNDPECLEGRNGDAPDRVGAVVPSGGAGGAGEGGAGGTNGMPPPGAGALLGTVTTIVQPDLSRAGTPEVPLEIRVPSGTGRDIVGSSGTDGSFRLDGVARDEASWAAVGSFTEDPSTQVFMDTLQVVDTAAGEAVELVAMRRSVLEELAINSFSNGPVELDLARGHALLRFVDEDGDPIPGLRLAFPTFESADIAYDAGDLYSDASTETSSRGTIALLNLVAPEYPGGVANVVVEIELVPPTVTQFRPSVRVASASVTVLTVELDLKP